MMMCQWGDDDVSVNDPTAYHQLEDTGKQGGCACVGKEDIWEISLPFPQFFH